MVFPDRGSMESQVKKVLEMLNWLLHFVGRRQAAKSWSGGRHRVQRGGAAL